jgi:hypothetical protein
MLNSAAHWLSNPAVDQRMLYIVEAKYPGPGEVFFRSGKKTSKDAVETAHNLLEQGIDYFTITDEAGRGYTASDFHELLDDEL